MPITNTLAVASARGFGFGTEDAFGEQSFTSPGTYTFYVPAGVTSVSAVAIGGGGGGGRPARYTDSGDPNTIVAYSPVPGSLTGNFYSGGGGGLAYKNSISVTPGQALTVVVGSGGGSTFSGPGSNGGDSYVQNAGATKLVHAGGGSTGTSGAGGAVIVGDGGGAGGAGANWSYAGGSGQPEENVWRSGSGGGAAGYSGNGGAGVGSGVGSSGSGGGAGSGGGGQFGQYTTSGGVIENTAGYAGAAGGGTGLFGQGTSGAGGAGMSTPFDSVSYATGGGGGSSGTTGSNSFTTSGGTNGTEGLYGGGGANGGSRIRYDTSISAYTCSPGFGGEGAKGAVRIIWSTNPTVTRSFPSTNVGQL